jgi:hypothetical protein
MIKWAIYLFVIPIPGIPTPNNKQDKKDLPSCDSLINKFGNKDHLG